MSINKKQFLKASSISLDDDPVESDAVVARPRTAPGQLMGLQAQYQKAVEEIADLKDSIEQSVFRTVPLNELHEVAGRRRKLGEQEYAELRENLRGNPLVTPVTVRLRDAGGYEIVSGHNRVAAYRELGKSTIDCVVQTFDDTQAGVSAFYANLLQTDLSDFEKYLGFRMIRDELALSQDEIASHSGLSKSFISRLMAFEDLPEAALQIIAANPSMIGSAAAHRLAMLTSEGKEGAADRVVNVLKLLAEDKVDQAQAVKLAMAVQTAPPNTSPVVKPIKIKSGKLDYCAMRLSSKTLRIDFRSEDEANAVAAAVRSVLEDRAEHLRTGRKP